jgi:L-rhamnose mutarotase
MDQLPAREVMRRWWTHMADTMATNLDGPPVTVPLRRMFYPP